MKAGAANVVHAVAVEMVWRSPVKPLTKPPISVGITRRYRKATKK